MMPRKHPFDPNYAYLGGTDLTNMPEDAPGMYHPAAMLMPYASKQDGDMLHKSISAHGLREPIVLLDGLILDGRNRQRALGCGIDELRKMKTADGKPAVVEVKMTDDEAIQYVLDRNLPRRHLTAAQKRALIDSLINLFGIREQGRPEKNMPTGTFSPTRKEIADMTGASKRTVSRVAKANKEEAKAAKKEGREPRPLSERPKPKPKPAPKPKPKPKPKPGAGVVADILTLIDGSDMKSSDIILAVLNERPALRTCVADALTHGA